MIDDLMRWVHQEIEEAKAQEMAEGQHSERRLPVSVWAGFADVGRGRGREVLEMLAEAGVSRVIFTPTNDAASTKWKWQPARAQLLRGLQAAKALNLEVWLGPWVRCDKRFLDETGQQLRELADEVGGVDGWELDAEGSWEVTARNAGRSHRDGISGAVAECLPYLTQHMTPQEMLGATLLYFNRPAGDALLRMPQVTTATIQAYSVWFDGTSSKAKATHTPNFQPGTLQERAWANYQEFKQERDLVALEMGLGWWAQDRSRAPGSLRLSKAEAFRRASDACLRLGADGVSGWAMHLWDSPTKASEKEYLRLVLEEVKYLTQARTGAGAAPASAPDEEERRPASPAGTSIDWSGRWYDEGVANGGRPAGFRSVKGLGLSAPLFGAVAKVVRGECLSRGWPLGTCVPFEQEGTSMLAVFQLHTATWRGGKLVKGRYNGLTVFAEG